MKVESYIFENGELNIDFIPSLAFLFFEGDREDIFLNAYQLLKQKNPEMEVIGINGKGGNINSHIPFITNENQISMLLFDVKDFFVKLFDVKEIKDIKTNFIKNYNHYNHTATIVFFPFKYDTNNFLDYIQDDKNMYHIYGGVYSDTNEIGCFYDGKFYNDKVISIFFNQDKIEFFSVAIHGWKPIGINFKITKSYKNIVYEIDNEPALKVIEEYVGKIKQENIDSFLHPFCVYHKGSESLAAIKSIDRERQCIEFFKYIYNDEVIKITIPINQHKMMKLVEEQLKGVDCDGLFMFSCVGRYAYYGDLLEFEIAKVAEYLKVPFGGFLTYGEIGSNQIHTKSILQNQTMNLVFFKGKQ